MLNLGRTAPVFFRLIFLLKNFCWREKRCVAFEVMIGVCLGLGGGGYSFERERREEGKCMCVFGCRS